jgi:hypothetical protein
MVVPEVKSYLEEKNARKSIVLFGIEVSTLYSIDTKLSSIDTKQ